MEEEKENELAKIMIKIHALHTGLILTFTIGGKSAISKQILAGNFYFSSSIFFNNMNL